MPFMIGQRELGYSHDDIATQLNRAGQTNQRGRPWNGDIVRKALIRAGFADITAIRQGKAGAAERVSSKTARARQAYQSITPMVIGLYAAGHSTKQIAMN